MAVLSDIQGQNWLVPSKQTNSEDLAAGRVRERERDVVFCVLMLILIILIVIGGVQLNTPSQTIWTEFLHV